MGNKTTRQGIRKTTYEDNINTDKHNKHLLHAIRYNGKTKEEAGGVGRLIMHEYDRVKDLVFDLQEMMRYEEYYGGEIEVLAYTNNKGNTLRAQEFEKRIKQLIQNQRIKNIESFNIT